MSQDVDGITIPDDGQVVFGRDLVAMVRGLLEVQEEVGPISGEPDVWVDPVNGIDGPNRGFEQRPVKTLAYARSSGLIPKVIMHTTRVWVKEGVLEETIQVTGHVIVGGDLIFTAVPNADPFPTSPFPWGQILRGLRAPVGLTGPISGTATGGTNRTIQLTGAGWTPGELKNKFFVVTSGTGMFTWGRILGNTADEFEVSGYFSSPFDNTTVFYLAEEAVTVRPPSGASFLPMIVGENGGGNQLGFYGFRFEMQTGFQYASTVGYLTGNMAWIIFNFCSFIGNDYPTTVGPMSSQVLLNINTNWGPIRFDACAFWVPETTPAGKFSGAMWPFGPNGSMEFRNCVSNDNFQFYYGQVGLYFSLCSIRYRANMLEQNVSRGTSWFRMYSCYIDANSRSYAWRFDGPERCDWRDCLFENAPGDGISNSIGHQGEGAHLYMARCEINGCGRDGVGLHGNSLVTIWNCRTNAGDKNTRFGVRVDSGSQIRYLGTNTLTGNTGDVNLGDNVTAVNHGVEATDTTHLTRVSQAV